MSARWIIYRNKKHLGPFSAVEVRALLREGSIDPFDLIAKEGSKVYRELVEVDEVFQEEAKPDLRRTVRTFSEPQGAKSPPSFKEEHTRISFHGLSKQKPDRHDQHDGAFSDSTSTTVSMTPANTPDKSSPVRNEPVREESLSFNVSVGEETSTNAGSKSANEYSGEHYLKQNLQLAVDLEKLEKSYDTPDKKGEASARQVERHRRSKKDPKQFYLMAKGGRIWGPLGSSEIQNLFFKGVLDRSIQVAKSGSSKSVSIGEFVAKYKQARQGNLGPGNRLMQGAHPFKRGNNISDTGLFRIVNYMRFTRERLTLLYILLGAALLGMACSIWLLYSSDRSGQAAKSSRTPSSEMVNRQDDNIRRQVSEKAQKTERAISPRAESPRHVAAVSKKTVTRPKTPKRQVVRKTTPPRRYIAPRRSSQVYQSSKRAYKPAAIQRRAPAAAVRQVSRTPVTKRAAPPRESGPNLTTLQNGQRVQRLGPLRYNPSDLNVCTGACRVTFRGGQGFLTAAFFKAAWGDKLTAKGGTAYLTGIIKKNGNHITILVQGVD